MVAALSPAVVGAGATVIVQAARAVKSFARQSPRRVKYAARMTTPQVHPVDVELLERAAILEFCGNLPRERADQLARELVAAQHRPATRRCSCQRCVAAGRSSVLG